jgi:hypothetical protein
LLFEPRAIAARDKAYVAASVGQLQFGRAPEVFWRRQSRGRNKRVVGALNE